MKDECNIIRDILPLYVEDMASANTIDFVKEHLETCDKCRRELENMRTPNRLEENIDDMQYDDAMPLKKFKKKWKRQNAILVCATAFITIIIGLICIISYQKTKEKEDVLHLGLDAEIIEIDTENNLIYVKDINEKVHNIFGGRCEIDCKHVIEREKIFCVDYDVWNDIKIIKFEELQVGDKIILGIYESELSKFNHSAQNFMSAEQIQLCP